MKYIAQYILFVYEKYIKEDWSVINVFGKMVLYPFWFIRMLIAISFSIVAFPLVLLHMNSDFIYNSKITNKLKYYLNIL